MIFFDNFAKNPNLKKMGRERGSVCGGRVGWRKVGDFFNKESTFFWGGEEWWLVNVSEQMFQIALLLFKENNCAK